MRVIARHAAAVAISFAIGGCAGVGEEGSPAAGPSETGDAAEGSPEQYLTLISALEDINRVINLGNEGHDAIQAIFDTPDAFSQESLDNIQRAREKWQQIEGALTVFTPEAKRELENLVPGIRVLEVAVEAWYDFFDAAENAILTGGGPQKAERFTSLEDYANGETTAGMGFMQLAAEEAVERICAIDLDAPACFLNSPPPN